MDIVIKNNLELIKGVDRATTTTVSALRTAVIVAQALANQQLVLDQITALNSTTSRMIESTSEMLKENSTRIQAGAAASSVGLPELQKAFANIYATMDAIDTYKVAALDSMAATIGTLETETVKPGSTSTGCTTTTPVPRPEPGRDRWISGSAADRRSPGRSSCRCVTLPTGCSVVPPSRPGWSCRRSRPAPNWSRNWMLSRPGWISGCRRQWRPGWLG